MQIVLYVSAHCQQRNKNKKNQCKKHIQCLNCFSTVPVCKLSWWTTWNRVKTVSHINQHAFLTNFFLSWVQLDLVEGSILEIGGDRYQWTRVSIVSVYVWLVLTFSVPMYTVCIWDQDSSLYYSYAVLFLDIFNLQNIFVYHMLHELTCEVLAVTCQYGVSRAKHIWMFS